jgi:hypothetical protein
MSEYSLERILEDGRARPTGALRARVRGSVASERRGARLERGSRVAFTAAVLAAMVGSLASFGSLGYAASGAAGAAHAVAHTLATKRQVVHTSSAQTQYASEKVALCHRRPNGTYVLVQVPATSVKAHLARGDKRPVGGNCPVVKSAKKVVATPPPKTAGVSGGLPFTGQGLAATTLAALALLASGVLMRRAARKRRA